MPSSSVFPSAEPSAPLPLLAGRNYRCQCGWPVFFRNSKCLACQTPLGYDPERGALLPLMPGPQPGGLWQEWQTPATDAGQDHDQADADADVGADTDAGTADAGGDTNTDPNTNANANANFDAGSGSGSDDDQNHPAHEAAPLYKRCFNLTTPARCNWLVPQHDPLKLCRACRLNHIIPDLANPAEPDNGYLWGLIEMAKRRLVSSLILLELPVASRISEDPERGLMFDFLRSPLNGPHILTGHDSGLITLNLDEADDAKREAVRKAMREPYRTLLGHFRHEIGHYYWDRLVAGTAWMDGFHQLFGDESADYAASLRRNYERGPPQDWAQHFVSAYASCHPWEDWAECWAHYLHMRDGIDTALSLGLDLDHLDLEVTPFTLDELYQPEHPQAAQFLAFLNHWTRLTTMLNEMSRSMGQPDFYPFVLPTEVVAKLHFIHLLVISRSWLQAPDGAQQDVPAQTSGFCAASLQPV
ncbi:MAG: putative zinc-binding peptidase [Pseudomonadota bacterium]|nr:putative zinc-binding peptidase [Pseudomonadota bacterium]